MKQRRFAHSCTSVWVEPHPRVEGVIAWAETATAILSVVVAGGRCSSTPLLTLYPRILQGGRSDPLHLHCRDLPPMEGHLAGAPSPPCPGLRTQDGPHPHLLTQHGYWLRMYLLGGDYGMANGGHPVPKDTYTSTERPQLGTRGNLHG